MNPTRLAAESPDTSAVDLASNRQAACRATTARGKTLRLVDQVRAEGGRRFDAMRVCGVAFGQMVPTVTMWRRADLGRVCGPDVAGRSADSPSFMHRRDRNDDRLKPAPAFRCNRSKGESKSRDIGIGGASGKSPFPSAERGRRPTVLSARVARDIGERPRRSGREGPLRPRSPRAIRAGALRNGLES